MNPIITFLWIICIIIVAGIVFDRSLSLLVWFFDRRLEQEKKRKALLEFEVKLLSKKMHLQQSSLTINYGSPEEAQGGCDLCWNEMPNTRKRLPVRPETFCKKHKKAAA